MIMKIKSKNNIMAIAFVVALCVHGLILVAPGNIFTFLKEAPLKEELFVEINIEKPMLLPEIKKIAEKKIIKEKRPESGKNIDMQKETIITDEVKIEEKVESEDTATEEMFRYKDAIRQRIESCRRYPRSARKNRIEGISTVFFTVLSDGSVRDVRLAGSSGYKMLDEEALKNIKRIKFFPPIPDEVRAVSIPMEVSIVFSLKE